jgi:signal transduction histidine kinase
MLPFVISRAQSPEMRRLLGASGAAVWLMVGAPIWLRGSSLETWRVWAWSAAYATFALALFCALRSGRTAFLAIQPLAVVALVLTLCDGFEGALLVLVALQLGGRTRRAVGMTWIAIQSALVAGAVAVHWSPSAALTVTPPYLGFQLLAFFFAEAMARLAQARALGVENERLAERLRISRELHDRLGHHLTALNLNLEVAARQPDALAAAKEIGRGLIREVRAAVEELREPERLDVCGALRLLAEELPQPRMHLTAPQSLRLRDPRSAVALLRCVQEIATNSARHGGAANLWIELSQEDGTLLLRARDDGKGACEVRPGNGLRGMRERVEGAGGTLRVETGEGQGFSVLATLPS